MTGYWTAHSDLDWRFGDAACGDPPIEDDMEEEPDPEFCCDRCGGSGRVHLAAAVYDICPDCRGTGECYPDVPQLRTLGDIEDEMMEEAGA